MPSVPFSRLRVFLFACLVLAAGAWPPEQALAQAGPVLPHTPNNWYVGPGGTVGFSIANGIVTMDADSNGVSEHHPLPPGVKATDQIKLSPSRTVLYSAVGPRGTCGGPVVRFFSIPLADNAPMVALADSICLPSSIAWIEFFDRPAFYPQRIASIATTTSFGQFQVLCVDLVSGANALTLPITGSVLELHYAPSGEAAWLKSGVTPGTTADFRWIELCSGSLGTLQSDPFLLGLPLSGPGFVSISAETQVSGSGLDGVTFYPNPTTELSRVPLASCPPSPTLGACCLPLGGCYNTTSADCATLGGSWQGAGTACLTAGCPPPPAPSLHATLTGPPSVTAATEFAYVVTGSNTGNAAANSVILRCPVPTGATYVRASGNGFANGGTAQWSIPSLAPSAAVSCTLTVRAWCTVPTIVASGVTIQGTPGGTVNGTGTVTTTVTAHDATPLTLTLSSTPLSAPPLGSGDRVRHTLTFTNTLAVVRPGLWLSLQAGASSTMDALVSASTGSATVSGSSLYWQGDVAPSQTVQVVFDTRISECRAASAAIELLNGGSLVSLRNPCNVAVGSATPHDTIALAPPAVRLAITAPALGLVQRTSSTGGALAAFSGGVTEFSLWVVNSTAAPTGLVDVTLPLGSGLVPVGVPAYEGPGAFPAGWDSLARRISWQGSVAAHDSIRVRFSAYVDTTGSLQATLAATGSSEPCFGNLAYTLAVLGLRPEPAAPHLLGLSRYEGVWAYRPGASTGKERVLGYGASVQNGFTRTPAKDVWIAAPSCLRVNLQSGALEVFDASFNALLGMELPTDVAYDPGDSTLVFGGYTEGQGLRITRYDPRTRTATPLYVEPSFVHGTVDHVKIDAQRRIYVVSGRDVLWFDPAAPSVAHTFSDPGYGALPALTLDRDQSPLVLESQVSPTRPGKLASIDRVSGAFTTLTGASALQSYGSTLTNLAVAPDSTIYTSFLYGGILRLTRPSWTLTSFGGMGYNDDLEWIEEAPVVTDAGPDAAGARRTLALSAPAPNPAGGEVGVTFTLPEPGEAMLEVFDLVGRRVRRLASGPFAAGEHAVRWDGRDASGRPAGPGLYFIRLETGGGTLARRLVRTR